MQRFSMFNSGPESGTMKRTTLCLVAIMAAVPVAAQAQQVRVTGTVTTAEDQRPLVGAAVMVKGSAAGTLTAANGRYMIAAGPNDTLVFSHVGRSTQEVAVAGREFVNVALPIQALALAEIVVTGYGTQQRRDVTGAVASVRGEALTEVATPSVEQALQGRVAGVQVTPESGEPGAGAVIRIRGVGTLNNASPLYVVDGMLLDDIQFLNPNDIQGVEVLKDASATAIYGSRGANGVIIITTKKGAADRSTRFTLNAYTGTQRVLNPIDMVTAQQYATLANEQGVAEDSTKYFEDPNAVGTGTNWQDLIFESAPMHSVQVAASGGTDRITYYFSGNVFRQAGVLPKSDFNRVTLRLNNDYQLTDYLLLGHNIAFSTTDGERPPDVLNLLYRADPTIAPTNEDGTFANGNLRSSAGNPAATVFYTRNQEDGRRLVGNLFADLNFLQHFTLRSSFGLDYEENDFRSFVPVYVVSPTQQNVESTLRVELGKHRSWLWENTLNFNWSSDRHRVNVLGGVTAQDFHFEELGGTRRNIVGEDESLWYLDAGSATGQTNFNPANEWRMLSFLFRTNYTLLGKYLFTGSLRVDGSSRFGEENRYGTFPSFALGWNLSDEPFFPDIAAVSAVKLRGSWGEIGNDKIGSYPGVPTITSNLNAVFGPNETLAFGATAAELANPEVRWERTRQWNVGADMALFDGRLTATLDYYNRLTDGILVRVPIPGYVGVGTEPFVNAAEVENRGFEAVLGWSERRGDFDFEFNVNGATVNNEVKELGEGREEIFGGGLGNEVTITTRTVVGQPIGSFWGFKVAGVWQSEQELATLPRRVGTAEQVGDLRYLDTNGDDQVTDADKTFIGSPIPDLIYGFNTRVRWRAFDVSATFSGQSGNEVFNGKKAVRFGVDNFETSFLNRWTPERPSNIEPRITRAGHNYVASDRFIEDGSFFKLHSAQLGFRLPQPVVSRLNFESARLYVNGTNLFNITDYTGYTPELTVEQVIRSGHDLGIFPVARTFTFGLDVTF